MPGPHLQVAGIGAGGALGATGTQTQVTLLSPTGFTGLSTFRC